jgi:3-oxoacyl-[acyl-carrier-protein] synthase II
MRALQTAFMGEIVLEGADPSTACRPFDADRKGMVPGEGSAALILEEAEHAQRRGATIYGQVLGASSSCARSRCGRADIRTAVRNAIEAALKAARLQPQDVGHIHAHGLGSRFGDEQEALAIHDVFSDRSPAVPVVAAKALMGNLGASGGLVELVLSLLALRAQRLPRQANHDTPDRNCPIFVVPESGAPAGKCVLNLNYTPVGQATAVIVAGPAVDMRQGKR